MVVNQSFRDFVARTSHIYLHRESGGLYELGTKTLLIPGSRSSVSLDAGVPSGVETQLGKFNPVKPYVQSKEGKDSVFIRDVIFGSHGPVYG